MRKNLPQALTAIVGFILVVDYYFKINEIRLLSDTFTLYGTIIAAFALMLGAFSVARIQILNIIKKGKEWYLSVLLLGTMILFISTGLSLGTTSSIYKTMYNTIITIISTHSWTLVGAATFTAAIRVFRVKSIESTLLFLAAMLVTFATVPIGTWINPEFKTIGDWIMSIPTVAGNRGFIITAAIGGIVLSFRTLIGKEKRALGVELTES